MATATITVIPAPHRADGSPFDPNDYGGSHVFRDGVLFATLDSATLVATDASVVPGVTVYTASVFDKQVPPAEGGLSSPVTAPALTPPVLAPPNAPSLTVTVA